MVVGGGGEILVCVLTFLDDLLNYGYNTGSAWKGGPGVHPQKNFIRNNTNPAILDNSGG